VSSQSWQQDISL
jgi:hypothetical protein